MGHPAVQEDQAMTAEEIQKEREDAAKEVFGDETPAGSASNADDYEPPVRTETKDEGAELPDDKGDQGGEKPDPFKGVDPALREIIVGLQSTNQNLSDRLKQSERRIGSLTNELHTSKEAAKTLKKEMDEAPTQSEIDAAAKSKEKWDELKAEFPEWAAATEDLLAAQAKDFEKKIEAIKPKDGENVQAAEKVRDELIDEFMSIHHKDWKTTINTDDFNNWFAKQGDEIKGKFTSPRVSDAIHVLNEFERSRAESGDTGKTAAEIAAQRKKRLASSQVPSSGRTRKPGKTPDDMSNEEYRASISWDDL